MDEMRTFTVGADTWEIVDGAARESLKTVDVGAALVVGDIGNNGNLVSSWNRLRYVTYQTADKDITVKTDWSKYRIYPWTIQNGQYIGGGWKTADFTISSGTVYNLVYAYKTNEHELPYEEIKAMTDSLYFVVDGESLQETSIGIIRAIDATNALMENKNLFNEADTYKHELGYNLSVSGGLNYDPGAQNAIYSDFIPVEENQVYTLQYQVTADFKYYGCAAWIRWFFYDSDKNLISYGEAYTPSPGFAHYYNNITTPANAVYFRVSCRMFGDGELRFVKGIEPAFNLSGIASINGATYLERYWNAAAKDVWIGQNVKSVNHRGYNTIAPENTLEAYKLSRKRGFRYVETDIDFTSDNVPVCLHDETINRTARNADGSEISDTISISSITHEQALAYDFGIYKGSQYAGTKIPTLDQFVALCKKLGLHPYIELKSGTQAQISKCVDIVKKNGMKDKVSWISFNATLLQWVNSFDQTARLGLVANSVTSDIITTAQGLKTNDNEVFIDSGGYTDAMCQLCIDADIPLEVWAIDSPNTIANLPAYISGVTSDNIIAEKVLYTANID